MNTLSAYWRLIRPGNALLSTIGVLVGFIASRNNRSTGDLVLLLIAAASAVGFGNCINDIKDVEGDRVNHPDRPLPRGCISIMQATLFCVILSILSVGSSIAVSPLHGIAATIPLLLLTAYTFYWKATPLFGNAVVSGLVAYTIIFGCLGTTRVEWLIVPAALAFLVNMCREIIKDLQDKKGDESSGVFTTAMLSEKTITTMLITLSLFYGILLPVPFLLGHFNLAYLLLGITIALPLHGVWLWLFFRTRGDKKYHLISNLIKLEMVAGLCSLFIDTLL
ncbi:MAG: geranylgeranylglycerol-phosphate geranylgeranyltransferase [Chitinivibrionales bacterium]|nr:geranylgeranylglycerol-phosphate geranylgeranyltransferase [Chitinivibrionales bacterium]